MADPVGTGYDTARQAASGIGAGTDIDRTQARKLVLVSLAFILAINVYRGTKGDGSLYKRLWGTGVLGVMLSIGADFVPQIAGPFALVVALGSYNKNGDEFLQSILGKAAGSSSSSSSSAAANPGRTGDFANGGTGGGGGDFGTSGSAAAGTGGATTGAGGTGSGGGGGGAF